MNKFACIIFLARAPEDGYYAFIFGGRERGSSSISGSVVKISGTNPNDIDTLCSFTGGNDDWQTQACSVSFLMVKYYIFCYLIY